MIKLQFKKIFIYFIVSLFVCFVLHFYFDSTSASQLGDLVGSNTHITVIQESLVPKKISNKKVIYK